MIRGNGGRRGRRSRGAWKVLGKHRMQLVWRDFEPRTEKGRQGFKLVLP